MRTADVAIALTSAGLNHPRIMRGRIADISHDGELMVEQGTDVPCLPCDFLRTSSGPLPLIRGGDVVLYIRDGDGEHGYVLGVVQRYAAEEMPSRLTIEARERVELRCGTSSVTMTKEGAVLVKGEQLVSRASGVNKIKGAAVKIN